MQRKVSFMTRVVTHFPLESIHSLRIAVSTLSQVIAAGDHEVELTIGKETVRFTMSPDRTKMYTITGTGIMVEHVNELKKTLNCALSQGNGSKNFYNLDLIAQKHLAAIPQMSKKDVAIAYSIILSFLLKRFQNRFRSGHDNDHNFTYTTQGGVRYNLSIRDLEFNDEGTVNYVLHREIDGLMSPIYSGQVDLPVKMRIDADFSNKLAREKKQQGGTAIGRFFNKVRVSFANLW